MFAPVPTVTLTTPLTELVIVAFELEEVEATFSLAGTASVIFSFAPGWVVTVVEQPAVALLTPAVAVHVGGADRERELRALDRRAGAVLADLDRRGGLRIGDRHLRLLAGRDEHLGLRDLVVLRKQRGSRLHRSADLVPDAARDVLEDHPVPRRRGDRVRAGTADDTHRLRRRPLARRERERRTRSAVVTGLADLDRPVRRAPRDATPAHRPHSSIEVTTAIANAAARGAPASLPDIPEPLPLEKAVSDCPRCQVVAVAPSHRRPMPAPRPKRRGPRFRGALASVPGCPFGQERSGVVAG